jgi:hypothetical protein
MLVTQMVGAKNYPLINHFIETVLDMQFADVRAMLQLPRPDLGIIAACNFAIVSTLCNLISGISTTIYKPSDLLNQVTSDCPSGRAFKELIRDFFSCKSKGANDIPENLYNLCRNPLAHSAGIADAALPRVYYTRVFHGEHDNAGWNDKELDDLERERFRLPYHSIAIRDQEWTIHCDCFYFEVIKMLRALIADVSQAQAAENRFSQGVYNWRKSPTSAAQPHPGAFDYFYKIALEYYVSGSAALLCNNSLIAGILQHHAVEFLLKGQLSKTIPLEDLKNRKKFGHKLPKLWIAFKSLFPTENLTEFDILIDELEKFETIRYPDEILDHGAQISLGFGSGKPVSNVNPGRNEPEYQMGFGDLTALFARLFPLCRINPKAYFSFLSSWGRQVLTEMNVLPKDWLP